MIGQRDIIGIHYIRVDSLRIQANEDIKQKIKTKEITISNIQRLNISKYDRLPLLYNIIEEQRKLKILNVLLPTVYIYIIERIVK